MQALKDLADLEEATTKAVKDAVAKLTDAAHRKIVELANAQLHTRRQLYIKALSVDQEEEDVWVITLDAKAVWIDNGQREFSMLDGLLKSSKAKPAKDGSMYLVVPFKHGPGKGKTNSTPAQQSLTSTVKAAMKEKGIPFAAIEKDAKGNAKIGKIRSFNINDQPLKTENGPGQGHGPIGSVRQGPNARQAENGGPGGGGKPFLAGVSIYQIPDEKAKSGVRREILTFRIASSKHQGSQRWRHPGTPPMNLMQSGLDWALEEFSKKIEPEIMAQIRTELK